MKKIITCIAIFCSLNVGFGQVTLDKESTQTTYYCQVEGFQGALMKRVKIEIDYGQGLSIWKNEAERDEVTGKVRKFKSMIDVLNYMNEKGWTYVSSSAYADANGNKYYFYLLEKKVNEE